MIIGHVTLKPTVESIEPRTYNIHILEGEVYVETPRGHQVYQTFADALLNMDSRDAVPLIKAIDSLLDSWHSAA